MENFSLEGPMLDGSLVKFQLRLDDKFSLIIIDHQNLTDAFPEHQTRNDREIVAQNRDKIEKAIFQKARELLPELPSRIDIGLNDLTRNL